jgi:hypothetical protein
MADKYKPPFEPKDTEQALKLLEELFKPILEKKDPATRIKLLSQGLAPGILMPRGYYYSRSKKLRVALDTNNSNVTHLLQLWRRPLMAQPVAFWPSNDPTVYFTVPPGEWDDNFWTGKPVDANTMDAGVMYELRLYLDSPVGPLLQTSWAFTATA